MRLSVLRASSLLGGCPADLGTSPASSTALRSLSSVALSSGYRPRSYAPNTSLAPNAPNSLLTEKLLNAYQPLNIKYCINFRNCRLKGSMKTKVVLSSVELEYSVGCFGGSNDKL